MFVLFRHKYASFMKVGITGYYLITLIQWVDVREIIFWVGTVMTLLLKRGGGEHNLFFLMQ